jgi:hypothetical protein
VVVIKPVAILLILAVSGTTYAETHICRSEVGFKLDVVNGKEFNSTVTDSSGWDFVQTEKDGKWILKMLGSDEFTYECTTQNKCVDKSGNGSGFYKDDSGIFRWISVISVAEKSQIMMVSMGLCTKI